MTSWNTKITIDAITQCAICEGLFSNTNNIENDLRPNQCVSQSERNNLQRSHTICNTWWFEGTTPFGQEGGTHPCPGCIKKWTRRKRIPKSAYIYNYQRHTQNLNANDIIEIDWFCLI